MFSLDGESFTKFSGNPVIPKPEQWKDFRDPKVRVINIWSSPPRVPLTASWIWITQNFDVIITIVAVIFILQIGIFVLRNFTFIFVTTIIIITWTNFSQRYSGMKPAQSGSPSYPRYLSSDLSDCNLISQQWQSQGQRAVFYGSPDLKAWEYLSEFKPTQSFGWECPDLFQLSDFWVRFEQHGNTQKLTFPIFWIVHVISKILYM